MKAFWAFMLLVSFSLAVYDGVQVLQDNPGWAKVLYAFLWAIMIGNAIVCAYWLSDAYDRDETP